LGQAFGIYGKSVKHLAVITFMSFVPVFVFRQFIPQNLYEAFGTMLMYIYEYGYTPEILNIALTAAFADVMTFTMIFFGIELAFFPLSVAAATYLVFKHQKQEEPTFGGMFPAALPILPKMMITSAIAVLMIYLLLFLTAGILGGILLLLVLYIAVGMVFYQHIVADVGRWGFNAISLSRFITRGRWFKVFFGSIIIFACYGVLAWLINILGFALGVANNVLLHLPFFLLQHLILSYFAIAFALWYFDIKRFHKLNFKEIEKEIMEKMQQHLDRFGRDTKEEKDEEEDR
jgi:hypothetical protein